MLGDADEGLLNFESMTKEHGIIPTIEHYVSIVEMYALPVFLDEALEFVKRMPMGNIDKPFSGNWRFRAC
uniref:Pentatricopeptide repeat-containing protein n=1 Tax=Noccaea caerulescens TaxID=107243 RepID=A0A1J3EVP3_NOCCA